MVTRELIQQYLDEYEGHSEAVAALVQDYPEVEKLSPLHGVPIIEALLHDLVSYESIENNSNSS